MTTVCWSIAPNGRYRIDLRLGSLDLLMMLDTGLVDVQRRVGFEIDPVLFDRLKQAGNLTLFRQRKRKDASGGWLVSEVAQIIARMLDPTSRVPIGPITQLDVMRGVAGVPSRVGVEFFHHLTGCRVIWDLDARQWCVECP
jgi:hypothetical protein